MKRPSTGFLVVAALVVGFPFLLWGCIQWKAACEPGEWGRTRAEDGRYVAHVTENDCVDDGQEPDGWIVVTDEKTKKHTSPVYINPVGGTDLEWQGADLVVHVCPGALTEEYSQGSGWPRVRVKVD